MPRPKVFKPDWFTTISHGIRIVRSDGMMLAIGITGTDIGNGGEWQVLAIETPSQPIKKARSTLAKSQALLDKHSHQLIGMYDLPEAMRVATEYARTWFAGNAVAPECPCDDIDPVVPGTTSHREAPPEILTDIDIDAIAFKTLGRMTPDQRKKFAQGGTKTSHRARPRVASGKQEVRDVRRSAKAASP